jgi:uncharacterized membrane protein YdbT with pleckstrin-like domain
MEKSNNEIKFKPSQLVNWPWLLAIILEMGLMIFYFRAYEVLIRSPTISENVSHVLKSIPGYICLFTLLTAIYNAIKVWCISYEISQEEIRIKSGILRRNHEFVELYRVKDYSLNQPLVYRLFGLGNLTLFTSDRTHPVFTLRAIGEPEKKYQLLRELVERNRKAKHVFEVD